jgi:hypothetical protein
MDGIGRLTGTTTTLDVSDAHFNAIWGAGDNDVFAVGTGEIRHYDGTSWTKMTVPTTASLTGIWGRASDDVFAVGIGATVLHYHAGIWKVFAPGSQVDFTSVSGSGDAIYATGNDGSVSLLIDTAP